MKEKYAAFISLEMVDVRDTLIGVEEVISKVVNNGIEPNIDDVRELQKIDRAIQLMSDLSTIFKFSQIDGPKRETYDFGLEEIPTNLQSVKKRLEFFLQTGRYTSETKFHKDEDHVEIF